MTEFDPFEQSLHDAFTRGDVDDDDAYEQVLARGRIKQRRRATAIAGVTGALVMVVFVALLATTGQESTVSISSPFGGNGIAATTSSAPESTTSTPHGIVPPPTRPSETTTPTTTANCPDVPAGSTTSPADLEATITFGPTPVVQGDAAPYTMTIANPTDHTVVVYLDLGTVLNDGAGGMSWQSVTASDTDKYVVYCFSSPYLVVPPHTTINESGSATTDGLSPGDEHLALWTQHLMVPMEQFGGPGGTLTIVASPETTTTPTTPTTTADTTTTSLG